MFICVCMFMVIKIFTFYSYVEDLFVNTNIRVAYSIPTMTEF